MKKTSIYFLLLVVIFFSSLQAQTYKVNGFAGFGYARFITDIEGSGLDKNGYSGTFRIMWQPEHQLRVGLETGYYHLYRFEVKNYQTDFGTTNAHSTLNALPVFLNMTMAVSRSIDIFAGIGPTILYTSFESHGSKNESSQWSTSYIIGGNYTHEISDKIKLGGELKYYHINKIEDGTLTLQFIFVYNLLSW